MKVSKSIIRKSKVGYVYNDGIVLIENRQVGSGKYKKEVEIAYIFPGEIILTGTTYSDEYALYDKIHSLVIHRPEMLLSGVQSARITVNDKSENMRKLGVITNNVMVQWITDDGAIFTMHQYAFLHSDVQVRFENVTNPVNQFITASGKGSVNDWRDEKTVDFIEEH
jgi:hypothetical protein